jgi:hypothetical protein
MNYDIIITKVPSPKIKNLIAHHFASSSGMALQDVLSELDRLPWVYKKNLTRLQMQDAIIKLKQLGPLFEVKESGNIFPEGHAVTRRPIPAPDDQKSPPSRPAMMVGDIKPEEKPAAPRIQRSRIISNASEVAEKKSRKKPAVIITATVLVIIGIGLVVSNRDNFILRRTGTLDNKTAEVLNQSGNNQRPKPLDKRRLAHAVKQQEVTPDKRNESQLYVDSAQAAGANGQMMIKFYLMAVSINKYNAAAWYGLINAYNEAGMAAEAEKAQETMLEIFGDEVASVNDIIAKYGALRDYAQGPDGVMRVEYVSRESVNGSLLEEAFALSKSLAPSCNCMAISINMRTKTSNSLLVYISTKDFPLTLGEFKSKARLTYLE